MKYKEWVEARMARASTPKSGAGKEVASVDKAMEGEGNSVQVDGNPAGGENANAAVLTSALPTTDGAITPPAAGSKMTIRPEDFEIVLDEVARAREDEQVAVGKLRHAVTDRNQALMQ